jgi:hypothetical protein
MPLKFKATRLAITVSSLTLIFSSAVIATPSRASASSENWKDFFQPFKVGGMCSLTSNSRVAGSGATEVRKITNRELRSVHVARRKEGEWVKVVSTSHVRYTGPDSPSASSGTRTYIYGLMHDGTVRTPQQDITSTGLSFAFEGFLVYPTIEQLRARGSKTTLISGRLSEPGQVDATKKIASETKGHVPYLDLELKFSIQGLPPHPIATPAGRFTDVVGLKVSLISMKPTNVAPSSDLAKGFSQASGAFSLLFGDTSVWWARGHGVVETDTSTLIGITTEQFAGCRGL